MEYSSSSTYSQKVLHSIYYFSISPLPIPRNYRKECSVNCAVEIDIYLELKNCRPLFQCRTSKYKHRETIFSAMEGDWARLLQHGFTRYHFVMPSSLFSGSLYHVCFTITLGKRRKSHFCCFPNIERITVKWLSDDWGTFVLSLIFTHPFRSSLKKFVIAQNPSTLRE